MGKREKKRKKKRYKLCFLTYDYNSYKYIVRCTKRCASLGIDYDGYLNKSFVCQYLCGIRRLQTS